MSTDAATIGWREATDEECRRYYREEFVERVPYLPEWITPTGPREFGVAFDERYPIQHTEKGDYPDTTREFIRRSTRTRSGPTFGDWESLVRLFARPALEDPLREVEGGPPGLADPRRLTETDPPAPRAVYYSLAHHERPWILAFDVDAKDVAVDEARRPDDDRTDRQIRQAAEVRDAPPEGYPYRFEHVDRAIDYAFDLADWLRERLGFRDVRVVYSGQGAHVYALDADEYHQYTEQSRKFLMPVIKEQVGIPVDTQVTPDPRRLMRLPYSLHADVCRVVTPIEDRSFDFRTDARPEFL